MENIMVLVKCSKLMEGSMKGNSRMALKKGKEHLNGHLVLFIKENSKIASYMDMASLIILMEISSKVILRLVIKMARVFLNIKVVQSMKENLRMGLDGVKGSYIIQRQDIEQKENLRKLVYMGRVKLSLEMDLPTMAIFKIIFCMVKLRQFINGALL